MSRFDLCFHKDEWFFPIVDVILVLTDSSNPRRYWSDLKIKLSENEGFSQLYEKIVQMKIESSDGKKYLTDTANTETIFRIIHLFLHQKLNLLKDGLQSWI